MEEWLQDSDDKRPGFRKPGHASSQQRNYRRRSPSVSRSSSSSHPDAGGKRDQSLSPRAAHGNAKTTDEQKKARRLEAEDEFEKDDGIRFKQVDQGKFDGNSQSRHHADNYDPGYSSYTGASDRRSFGASWHEDSRHDKDKNWQSGSDRWCSEKEYRDCGKERNRVRSYGRDAEEDIIGKGRGSRDCERNRDKERDRDRGRERHRVKDSDPERRESVCGGRDYFGSYNDRDRDRDKTRVYRTGYNDIELKDRETRNSRYDYRGRGHYRDTDAQKYIKRDRVSYKDDQRQKDYSNEKSDYVEREWSRDKEDVHDRDDHKGSDERGAIPEHRDSSLHHYTPGRAKAAHVSSKDEDDKGHNSLNQTDQKFDVKARSSAKKDVPTKPQVLKSGEGWNKDNHLDSKQDLTTKVSTGDAKSSKSSKWGPEGQITSENTSTSASAQDVANDVINAKLAAMKAAEIVNKNLGVAGFMSADQKKKLLWGAKKITTEQEPAVAAGTNRWDNVHFPDRDRQEKFNKLMGVKADAKGDCNNQESQDAGLFTEEKQRELQQDLEKQYTAGLRRRDGRTVGLGL